MASAGSIFVDLLLRDSTFDAGLKRSRANVRAFAGQAQSDMAKTRQAFFSVLSPVENISSSIRNLGSVLAASFSIQKLVQYSDTWKQLEGRLGLVVSETQNMTAIQSELAAVAERTRQPLEGVYNLYTRLSQAVPEAERAQYDILGVTESVNAALAITGEGSAQAASAILQFSQAVQSDFKASSQEINSLLDSAPRLAQALQKSFGDGSKSLKQLAADGDLSRDAILRALSGMGVEGKKLRDELAKIPPTVGQAFTELNNSFLQFIGKSKDVNLVTDSLGSAIRLLAQNLDLAAKALVAISVVFVARLVPGMVAAIASATTLTTTFISASLASARLSVAIGTVAFNSKAAAVAMTALAAPLAAISSGIALLGGPIGVAAIGTFLLLKDSVNGAKEAQVLLNKEFDAFAVQARMYAGASDELKKQIKQDTIARIESYQAELQVLAELANRLQNENLVFRTARNLGSKIGIDTSAEDVRNTYDMVNQEIERLKQNLKDFDNGGVTVPTPQTNPYTGSGDKKDKETKSLEKWLIKQKEALETMRQESQYVGMTTIEIEKLKDARQFEAEMAEKSYNLKGKDLERFKQQAEAIKIMRQEIIQTNYEISRSAQTGAADFFAKFSEDATNSADNIRGVLENAFKGAEDAFIEFTKTGKINFRDLANSIIEDLLRIQFRKTAAKLSEGLQDVLGGLFGGGSSSGSSEGGGIGGFLGKTFSGMFADGGYIEPGHWGIAGEAGAEAIFGGRSGATVIPQNGKGGNTYYVDAKGADMGAVRRIEGALMALAGPGVIENRVANAQSRGAL